MTPEELIEQALKDALEQDSLLSPRKELLTTSERNIAFHIAQALTNIIENSVEFMQYQVDVEYHRQGDGGIPKKLGGENAVPDIIIHKRGITHEEDNDANYLYMEIKLINNFTGKHSSISQKSKREAFAKDKHKLMLASSEKHYQHTAFLIINRNAECFLETNTNCQKGDSFRLVAFTNSNQ